MKKCELSKCVGRDLRAVNWKCAMIGAVITLGGGIIAALTGGSTEMYGRITLLPKFAPPAFIFPIVWTVIYILIGGAAGIIWCTCEKYKESDKYKGLLLFIVMMIFNYLWPSVFFRAQAYFIALLSIAIMLILTVFVIAAFARVNIISSIAMSIYLLWLAFAFYLNLIIMLIN